MTTVIQITTDIHHIIIVHQAPCVNYLTIISPLSGGNITPIL